MNIRDKMLATLEKVEIKKMPMPKSGGFVYVKPISHSLDSFSRAVLFGLNKPPYHEAEVMIQKRIFLERVCDENGKAVFTAEDWQQLSEGGEAAREALEEVFTVVRDFDREQNKESIKEAGNDSGAIQSDAQSSESPSPSESGLPKLSNDRKAKSKS